MSVLAGFIKIAKKCKTLRGDQQIINTSKKYFDPPHVLYTYQIKSLALQTLAGTPQLARVIRK